MTMIRRVAPAQLTQLGDDEVEIVMSTAGLARDGHVLVPEGCVLENYRANPIQLWQHDPEHPVGRNENIQIDGDKIRALTRFAPAGISHKADEIRGLVKAGIIRTVSVGFEPLEMEPLDPKKPRGGQRISKWELLECSFCSVPVDTGAVVTARAHERSDTPEEDWACAAARDLPIEDDDEWDGDLAAASIFEYAGGDDFDSAKARQGFLAYNAAKPKERSSYKLPIAHVANGALKVPHGAIRAAAARLSQTDIPEAVRSVAGDVVDHYKERAGMDKETGAGDRAMPRSKRARSRKRAAVTLNFTRGLYDVAQLACALQGIGYIKAEADWEAECEGDGSKVPGMLAEAMTQVAEALLAMTQEEVAELLAAHGADSAGDEDDDLAPEARAHIRAATTPAVRAWRRGTAAAKLRAGRVISAETARCLRSALEAHDEAMGHHRAAMRAHKAGTAMVEDLIDRAVPGSEDDAGLDDDVKEIQTSDGTDKSGGSENDRSLSIELRRRQVDLLALAFSH